MLPNHRCSFMALALMLISAVRPATAQQPPIGFLPGLGETPANWDLTHNAILNSAIAIDPFFPSLPTGSAIPTQRSVLLANHGSQIGSGTILIGHSNGGLVARYVSQSQSLRGTATIGSPNGGLPVGHNAYWLWDYGAIWIHDLIVTLNDFLPYDNYWIFDTLLGAFWWDILNLAGAFEGIADATGLNTASAAQVLPSADFLVDTLNVSSKVATELANAPVSVGITVIAESYLAAGPMRLFVDAGTAELISDLTYTLGVGAIYWASEIGNNYPLTAQEETQILDLLVLADFFFLYETVWCAGVSYPQPMVPWNLGWTQANDAFIGASYQQRPGSADNIVWNNAQAHMKETEEGDRVVDLLRTKFSIP